MKLPTRTMILSSLALVAIAAAAYVYVTGFGSSYYTTAPRKSLPSPKNDLTQISTTDVGQRELVLAGGCFWCTEAVFEQLKGVENVVSGYAGGDQEGADYESVSAGITDHAESVKISYDPSVISYGTLLKVFFTTAHDPTQLDRQGPDVGHQYRSTVFYRSEQEQEVAQQYIEQIDQAGAYPEPIATTLEPLQKFYPAEEYHQNYATKHPYNFYVRRWSLPKVRKTQKKFPELLKDNSQMEELTQR